MSNFCIWIDADAAPVAVKEIVFKAALKTSTKVVLVANKYQKILSNPLFSMVVVEKDPDAADFYIADNMQKGDIVITADIPLASEVVKRFGIAIDPKGKLYDEVSVGERLAMRDLMAGLRETGQVQSFHGAYNSKDKKKFADIFNNHLHQALARQK